MLYRVGRILQFAGLLLLPQAIVLELLGWATLGQSMLIAIVAGAVFFIGVRLQRASGH